MILGALITVIFTASNVYLGLKVGLTFSSSIPAAVISMAILRMFKHSNILENNMVQTQASAAGTLSAIIFILPGLLMLGYWQGFPFWQTLLLCACGGSLGVLFTIPLRRAMVVNSDLPYQKRNRHERYRRRHGPGWSLQSLFQRLPRRFFRIQLLALVRQSRHPDSPGLFDSPPRRGLPHRHRQRHGYLSRHAPGLVRLRSLSDVGHHAG